MTRGNKAKLFKSCFQDFDFKWEDEQSFSLRTKNPNLNR